jgi:hypothetical protein
MEKGGEIMTYGPAENILFWWIYKIYGPFEPNALKNRPNTYKNMVYLITVYLLFKDIL